VDHRRHPDKFAVVGHHEKIQRLDQLNRSPEFPAIKIGILSPEFTITVNANWRITFEFSDGNVYVVNYEDYH